MDYRLVRKNRKTVSMKLDPDGSVVVTAPLWVSRHRIDAFVDTHVAWVEKQRLRLRDRAAQEAALTPERIAALKRKAKTELPPRIAAYAAILGVRPTGFKVTSAAKRFGSCSAKNSLCFSWRLMQYPPEAIDYVVVHELCHILHHDHSPAFYAAVARVMPDYKRREKLLKTTPADD